MRDLCKRLFLFERALVGRTPACKMMPFALTAASEYNAATLLQGYKMKIKQRFDTRLINSTGAVMAAFVLSRALGLLRESLMGSAFSASASMDAFRAASRVTDTLYILVAGGALASAFIPTFTSYMVQGERKTAWQLASAITNLVLLVTLLASLITAWAAPWLVSTLLAPGYAPETQQLTVSLFRWMMASTVIFGVSGLLMGILNANDHFVLPALAPSMYNIGIIIGVLVFARWWGIHGVAVGMVLGALLHLLIQLPALRGLDWPYRPMLGLQMAGVREVGRLMGPRVLGLAITQLHFWVNTNLGSRIEAEGVVAALSLGWVLMLLPQGVFAQAAATVALPSFSAQAARQELARLRTSVAETLGMVIFWTLPATAGLILLRRPLVEMLFFRGEFDRRAVMMVAWALGWYAVGLVFHSGLEIVTRAFYALHDTMTPVWVGGAAMALNVALSILLSRLFTWIGLSFFPAQFQPWMPLGGLALANSTATALETWALTWLLRRRLDGLDGRRLWASLWRTVAGTAAMAVTLWIFLQMPWSNPWLVGGGGMAAGGAIFLLLAGLLRSPELAGIWMTIRSRWGRSGN